MKLIVKSWMACFILLLNAISLLAHEVDWPQLQPCWRQQPGTTLQKWSFGPGPASEGSYGPVTVSPDVSNNPGSPTALIVAEGSGVGWTIGDPTQGGLGSQYSTTNFGWWDLGFNGGGSIVFTIPNIVGPSGSTRFISIQVTEAIYPGTLEAATIAVVGGTLVMSSSVYVETYILGGQVGNYVTNYLYVFQVPGNTASDTITLTSATTGGGDSTIGGVIVETMLRSPAQNDSASATPLSTIQIPVLANDGGPNLTITSVGPVTGVGGTAVINGTNIQFTAPAGAGTAAFSYTQQDCATNTSTATVTVTVNAGVQPPQITSCATNRTLVADTNCHAVVPNMTTEVVATGTGVTVTQAPLPGTLLGAGTNLVTFTASNSGGSATCSATLAVLDQTPPVLALPANVVVRLAPGAASTNVSFTASANDACAGSVSVSCVPASGSSFAVGTTSVQCSANDGHGNAASGSFTVTVQPNSSYQDGDLLLVFRKDGASKDLLFNLGSVSNYLGLASGTTLAVTNFNANLVKSTFGSDLTGVSYVLLAATPLSDSLLRVWLSDAEATGYASDEPYSIWSGQRGNVHAVGMALNTYSAQATNQSLLLSPNDPGSYTYIASSGGALDVTTMGGAVPFVVEQAVPVRLRLFELKLSSANPKPVAAQVGGFTVAADGQMSFVAGLAAPAIVSQPMGQTVECGGSVRLSAAATGDEPLQYQWYVSYAPHLMSGFLASPSDAGWIAVGGNSPMLTINPVSSLDAGDYKVFVSNSGGSIASSVATLTVADTTPPVLALPANIVVRLAPGAASTNVSFTASANDACAGSVSVSCTPASGSSFTLGVTTVQCSANDGHGNAASGSFTVTVQPNSSYQEGDLLLVFRKDGASKDLLFNLGSVSNYLGLASGTTLAVTNFNANLVKSTFGSDLTGVSYVLLAATPLSDSLLRVWLSDAEATGYASDEPYSIWSGQRGNVHAVGMALNTYSAQATNQSLLLSPNDPGSYTYIASSGGALDVTTMGGSVPFVVEQAVPVRLRLFELKLSSANPKPVAVQVGGFTVAADGQMSFVAGLAAPAIVSQPMGQTVECGGSASLSAAATGDEPLQYQWLLGAVPIGGNSPTLMLSPVSFANAGSYRVIVSNSGGSIASSVAAVSVNDTTPPALNCPSNLVVNCQTPAGAVVNFTVTALDACAGNSVVTCTPPSGSVFPAGVTSVTCVADDGNQNTNRCSFNVLVQSHVALAILSSGTNVIISWPQSCQNFSLEQTANPGAPNSWSPVGRVPVLNGNLLEVTVPALEAYQFYRLRNP